MTLDELWRAALGDIELSISKANFVTWFKNTTIVSLENDHVVVGVPNGFAKEWLENKYHGYILKALRAMRPEVRGMSCVVYSPAPTKDVHYKPIDAAIATSARAHTPIMAPRTTPTPQSETNINPRYTFESFVVGEYNELAKAACLAVCESPGHIYNPLFIYGGVGLGKTHLLQAIGNAVHIAYPEKKIRYTSSERFTTELIEAIKSHRTDAFKSAYQKIDLLLIDDIQFLSGKEKTQQEFFHIFNVLYQLNKQVVMSSDRPPKAIATLEDRLRSRFEGGMIVDIGKPDMETRIAILQLKLREKNFALSDESLRFIAENITHNVRELEGALNRVVAACELSNISSPSIEQLQQILGDLLASGKRHIVHGKHVLNVISEFYEINSEELVSRGRKKEIVRPRQIAMYLLRTELNISYPGIGGYFGGRDHTTALHAYEKINKELEQNERLREEISLLKEKIYVL